MKTLFAALLLGLFAGVSQAKTFNLAWDPVSDSRVGKYVLAWGTSTNTYTAGTVKGTATTATTPDLGPGTYFFAVKACTTDESLCSVWSNEVSGVVPLPIPVPQNLRLQ